MIHAQIDKSAMTDAPTIRYQDYEKLLMSLSHRHRRRSLAAGMSVDVDDLMQEAAIGFVKATEKFDPTLGVKFSTYLWRAVDNNLNRYRQNLADHTRGHTSLDEPMTEDGSDMHEVVSSDHEGALDRLERLERMRENLKALSDAARKVILLLEAPPEELLREVQRAKDFSDHCKSKGFAAPNVKLDVAFICNALRYDDKTRRSVSREIRELIKGME